MENYCGKRLDNRYEIREIIGVGGMAVVYKAYDNIDDRIVAIKILKEEFLANEEFRRRFKNEAKAIAVLSHPNIVKVYDVSFGDRLQYIVMEYIEGITLKEYIEQQKVVNWKEAVHFVNQILKALQHAHDKGIVHRDIKPQNIMLLQDGTIKVSDFGIARFSRGDTRTMTESAIGSVHYISPEQARGEITDDKADIYSVGVVLYEMLTGQLPFQSDSAVSVAIMQLQQEAKRPRELNPDIPLGLEQITMRAMQKNPKNRYQSASEMLMDLDEFRKNPSVKFDYNYFVDNEPTKYVSAKGGVPVKPVVREQPPKTAAEDEEAEEDKKNNKTLPILFGVLAGVVVLVAIFVGVYFGVTARRVEVPNFVGKDFNEEISNNAEYTDNFTFETESVYSADAEPGTVLTQDPEAETKVRIHSTITLEIAYNEDSTQLTGIIGLNVDEAQSKLRGEGFEVKVITNYDPNAQEGVVYDTYPLEGSYVEDGQLITLYVATNDDPNATSVPYVIGYSQEVAKQLIESAGLKVGNVTQQDSEEKAGTVLSQSPEANQSASAGGAVSLVVSSGKAPASSATISVTRPNANTSASMRVYLDGKLVDGYPVEVRLDGGTSQITLQGSGSAVPFSVVIDDTEILKGTIDFTKDPPAVSSQAQEYPVAVPNVVGQTVSQAKEKLENAGFSNFVFVNEVGGTVNSGTVVSQDPEGNTKVAPSTEITLTVRQ